MRKIKSILLVDDDYITNYVNKRLIVKSELCEDVFIANNGAEALNFLKKNSEWPDLIFLDINMPVMDGFEFLQKYRALERSEKEKTIIVMLTTSTNSNDMDKVINLGNNDFLNKPLTKEQLCKVHNKYFGEMTELTQAS